jgi:hypothetical protein
MPLSEGGPIATIRRAQTLGERAEPEQRVPVLRSETRAADFRSKASAASTLARASLLQRVREQHSLAAIAWRELARSEDQRTSGLRHDLRPPSRRAGLAKWRA